MTEADERIKLARDLVTDQIESCFQRGSPKAANRALWDAAPDLFAAVDERDALRALYDNFREDSQKLRNEAIALRKRVAELENGEIALMVDGLSYTDEISKLRQRVADLERRRDELLAQSIELTLRVAEFESRGKK